MTAKTVQTRDKTWDYICEVEQQRDTLLAALKTAQYELTCLHPRLSGMYQKSVRAVLDNTASVITTVEKPA